MSVERLIKYSCDECDRHTYMPDSSPLTGLAPDPDYWTIQQGPTGLSPVRVLCPPCSFREWKERQES